MSNPTHSLPPEMMQRFRDKYMSTIPEKLQGIQQLVDEIEKTAQEQTLKDLRIHIHQIAGSAGTYGFPEISVLCKQFESEILKKMEEIKDAKGDPRWAAEFQPYLDKLKKGFSNDSF